MSVTPAPGAPGPVPRPHAVPLNRFEERSLSGLEHELRRFDPALGTAMSALTGVTSACPGSLAR